MGRGGEFGSEGGGEGGCEGVSAEAVSGAVVVVVTAMAHNIHFVQCLLHWMGVGSGG
jgi:hypothetical protein